MANEELYARLRLLCSAYGHEWRPDTNDPVSTVRCDDCHQIGSVINVRYEE